MKKKKGPGPIVEGYKENKKCNETIDESLAMLDEENDEEMRELLTAKANVDRVLKMEVEQDVEKEKDHGQR